MTLYAEIQKSRPSPQPDHRDGSAGVLDRSAKPLKESSARAENQNRSAPAVEFRNVHFSFDDEKVLDGVTFTVMRGEIKIILSGSGGGKSTILKLILGLLKPDEGQVLIDGEDITDYDESQLKTRTRQHRNGLPGRWPHRFALSLYDEVEPTVTSASLTRRWKTALSLSCEARHDGSLRQPFRNLT